MQRLLSMEEKKSYLPFIIRKTRSIKHIRKKNTFTLGKRQKFILSVVILSTSLFISEYLFNKYGFFVSLVLAGVTDIFIFWALYQDIKENFFSQIFILPFFYSMSFGLFYILGNFLIRGILICIYPIGLYSLFLSENIFTVASIRTIALLNGARIVSFIVTLITFFFLTTIIFSLRASVLITSLLFFFFSFFLILHSIWTYTLEKTLTKNLLWVITLSISLFEIAVILWFWPTNPTVVALFLTGAFYILLGLSHVWLEKRLFRGVLWEYIWVGLFAFFILIWLTHWQ